MPPGSRKETKQGDGAQTLMPRGWHGELATALREDGKAQRSHSETRPRSPSLILKASCGVLTQALDAQQSWYGGAGVAR
jgi:hypothetical protein